MRTLDDMDQLGLVAALFHIGMLTACFDQIAAGPFAKCFTDLVDEFDEYDYYARLLGSLDPHDLNEIRRLPADLVLPGLFYLLDEATPEDLARYDTPADSYKDALSPHIVAQVLETPTVVTKRDLVVYLHAVLEESPSQEQLLQ